MSEGERDCVGFGRNLTRTLYMVFNLYMQIYTFDYENLI